MGHFKTCILLLIVLATAGKAFSQRALSRLSIDVALNQTAYLFRADVNPAIRLGVGYELSDKFGMHVSYIHQKSIQKNPSDKTSVISFQILPRLVGTYKSKFSWYFPLGVSLVLIKDHYPECILVQNGATINIGTGVHLGLGKAILFGDVNIGLATSQYKRNEWLAGYGYLSGNVGAKIPIGKM